MSGIQALSLSLSQVSTMNDLFESECLRGKPLRPRIRTQRAAAAAAQVVPCKSMPMNDGAFKCIDSFVELPAPPLSSCPWPYGLFN